MLGISNQIQKKIIKCIAEAKTQQVDLIVFSELAICGYPPRDFLEFDDFVEKCMASIHEVAKVSEGISVIVGGPSKNDTGKGKSLFNSAFVITNQKIEKVIHKTLLPTYDVFDEYRYFEPNRSFDVVRVAGKKVGVAICEDLWNVGDNPLYTKTPAIELKNKGAELIVNISASPFSYNQDFERKKVLGENTNKTGLPIVYCNNVGAQTELIFDGGSFFMNADGTVASQEEFFKEGILVSDFDGSSFEKESVKTGSKIELIHDAIVLGKKLP